MGILHRKHERIRHAAICERDQHDGGDVQLCQFDRNALLQLQWQLGIVVDGTTVVIERWPHSR